MSKYDNTILYYRKDSINNNNNNKSSYHTCLALSPSPGKNKMILIGLFPNSLIRGGLLGYQCP